MTTNPTDTLTDDTDDTATDASDDAGSAVSQPDNPNFGVNDLDAAPERSFGDMGLDDRLVQALADDGKTHPFPIQALTLPMAIQRHDVIGQARTGTGKTLAFGLPLLQSIDTGTSRTQALVVVPTRELCLQVHADLQVGTALGVTTQTVYGGVGYDEQTEALTGGVHVVVGTPGRLLDMLNRGILDLSQCRTMVLDEADEMLDMGFLPDVERLLQAAGTGVEDRHTMLFSATMPASVVKLGRRYMDKPTFMRADTQEHETAPTVDQHFFQVFRMDKPRVLARILQQPERGNVYVFCRTKAMVDRLVRELDDLGVTSIAIHGDIRQASREKNMDRFRDGNISVLVATEVAARGLDVDNVTHVVNYDCPDDEKMYLHRIGRTARAGQRGVAVTFAEHAEVARASMIRKAIDPDGEIEVEEVFSTSDRLTELFDLPDTTPWEHLSSKSGSSRGGSSKGGSSRGSSSKGTSSRDGSNRGGSEKGSSGKGSSSRRGSGKARSSEDSPSREGSSNGRGRGDERPSGDGRTAGRRTSGGPAASSAPRAGRRGDRSATSPSAPDQVADTSGASTPTADGDGQGSSSAIGSVDDLVAERLAARRRRRSNSRGGSTSSRSDDGTSPTDTDRGRSSDGGDRSRGDGRSGSGRRGTDTGTQHEDGDRARSETSGDGAPRGGARARSRRKRGSRSSGSSSSDSKGGSDGADRASTSSSGSTKGRSGTSDDGSDRGTGRGRKGNGSGGRRGGSGSSRSSSGRGRGGGSSRGGSSRGSDGSSTSGGGTDAQVTTTAPGAEARGEGRPRLERRAAVERLP